MNIKDILNWRYAVKKYTPEIVSDDKVNQIVEAINLSASSAGLQPYRLLVVRDKELQQQLAEGSFNLQIAEASHLIVFAAFDDVKKEHIQDYMERIATARNTDVKDLSGFQSSLETYLLNNTPENNFIWASRQAYIGLGTGLVAAAALQVDATPMEGFDTSRFDAVLKLREKGLRSVVLLALGYRDTANDSFHAAKKVRLPLNAFVLPA